MATNSSLSFRLPNIEEEVLPGGLRVLWVEDHTFPVITVTIQIPAGNLLDPLQREGVAELTANCMLKGTKSLSGDAFSERFEAVGAQLFADAKGESTVFGLRTVLSKAQETVPLFWKMLVDPALEVGEFKRLKKEFITGLQAEYADPGSLAGKHFVAALFGSGYPAGRPHTEASVKKIEVEDIRDFFRRCYSTNGATIVFAGDLTVDQMKERWMYLFAERIWESAGMRTPVPQPSAEYRGKMVRIIDKPELTQTTLMIGHRSVTETDPSRIPLSIANFILGGGNFSSRLMARIRTETGRTYSVSSQLISQSGFGIFSIGTTTRNEQLSAVLESIFQTYDLFVDQGPTPQEIEKAKQYYLGSMAFELEGLNHVVDKLLWLRFLGKNNDYLLNFPQRICEVTPEVVKEALKSRFIQGDMVIIAVGKRSEIEQHLASRGEMSFFKMRSNPCV